MQTKQYIQKLLTSVNHSPNHRRGQNFLIDLNLMRVLIEMADIHSNDVVLEVGCGTGSLTEALAEKAGAVVTVEIEETLAKIAGRQLKQFDNVRLVLCDVLENKNTMESSVVKAIDAARAEYNGRFMLIANLPYSVACPVMLNFVTGPLTAECMYVTVQKEVAQRMVATAGDKEYGTLSIMLASTGRVKVERTLKPTVFWPEPQVDSAMLSFVRKKEKVGQIHDIGILSDVVALFMGHRRKMLKACTKLAQSKLEQIHNWPVIFRECAVDPHKRPEELSPESYVSLANLCAEQLKNS